MLQDALTEILQKENLHAVSVRRLCEMADLNRSTFYLNYETLEDFIMNYTDFYMQRIWSGTRTMHTEKEYEDAMNAILLDPQPYHALLKSGLYHQYILKEYSKMDSGHDAFMLLSSCCVSGAEQMILYLLEHPDLSCSKKEIAESLYRMNIAGEKEIRNLSGEGNPFEV